jgi:hypothetical protein
MGAARGRERGASRPARGQIWSRSSTGSLGNEWKVDCKEDDDRTFLDEAMLKCGRKRLGFLCSWNIAQDA